MTVTGLETGRPATGSNAPLRSALQDIAPFALGLIPFGLAVGGASAAADLSEPTALFGAVILLAGAAQLAAVETLESGGGVLSVVVVVGLLNLRFIFYGAGVAAWFAGLPLRRRLLLAFPVVDQTFMLSQRRFARECDLGWRQRYYVTATVVLGGTFVGCQVLAYRLGSNLPDGLGLHLAAPLAFAGMVGTSLRGRSEVIAGMTAAMVVVAGASLLGPVGLPLGVIAGVVAGAAAAREPDDASVGEVVVQS